MKLILPVFVCAIAGTGCQTPAGVRDTATMTSRLAVQLNGHIAQFADASNVARKRDAQRLSKIIEQAQYQSAITDVQFEAVNLGYDERMRKLVLALRSPEPPDAVLIAEEHADRLSSAFGANTYNPAPLAAIASTAGALAEPLDMKAQAITLANFFREVSDQLKSVNEKTAKTTGTAPAGSE